MEIEEARTLGSVAADPGGTGLWCGGPHSTRLSAADDAEQEVGWRDAVHGPRRRVRVARRPSRCSRPRATSPRSRPGSTGSPPARACSTAPCGAGLLAVGLALRGFDGARQRREPGDDRAHPRARRRTTASAFARGCAHGRTFRDAAGFDAVFCVGNSLAHAPDRRAALTAMARVLRPAARSCSPRATGSASAPPVRGSKIDDRLVERAGRRALISRAWTIGRGGNRA